MTDKAEQNAEENREANDLLADTVETPAVEREAEALEKQEAASEPEKKEPARGSKFQSRREEIYAKHRQSREPKDGEEEFAPVPPDREKVFFGQNTETRSDREAKRALERERSETGVDPTDDEVRTEEPAQTRHKLKVHGRELELSQEEIIAHAQKSLAADGLLDDAKRMREEHRQMLEEIRAANQNRTEEPSKGQKKAEEPATKPDTAELDRIIDRIQVGDKEEAAAALMEFGDDIRNRIEQRVEERIGNLDERIAATTRQTAEAERRREQTMATLNEFADDYPEFKTNESLQTALAHETAKVMKTHLIEAGVQPETLSGIQREHKLSEMEAVSWAYRSLRDGGFDVPDNASLLRTAGDTLRKNFGVKREPAPQPNANVPADRQERKQNMAPQPRRASAPPTTETQERNRDDARRQAVRQMKAFRRGGRV